MLHVPFVEDRELLDLRVYNVQLPNVGGRCIFHLETQSRVLAHVAVLPFA